MFSIINYFRENPSLYISFFNSRTGNANTQRFAYILSFWAQPKPIRLPFFAIVYLKTAYAGDLNP